MTRVGLLFVCLLVTATASAQVVEVIEPVKVAVDGADAAIVEFGPAIEIYNGIPSGRIIDCTINFIIAAPGGHEPPGIGAELVIPEPMLLVFTEHTGSYAQIGPATGAFLAELNAQGVEPAGPCTRVFHTEPEPASDGMVELHDADQPWVILGPVRVIRPKRLVIE